MFVDRAEITVHAGDGGAGCVSFRRGPGQPKGGPNGGDGGNGGSVVLVAESGMHTLLDFRAQRDWRAQAGEPGANKQMHGANAPDLEIHLPPGTMVHDADTGEVIHDLMPGDRFVVAKGGRGGFGNEHFKSPTNQAPRTAGPGAPGEARRLRLELKLIAEVGIVGLPNAGKSTLLAAVTRATPRIADYPFTTLTPQLGIASLDPERRIILADIPGLIDGASQGAGLGHDFLRHVDRTRVVVHLVEPLPADGSDPLDNYRLIRGELAAYSAELEHKPEIVAISKAELLDEAELAALVRRFNRSLDLSVKESVMAISAASGRGTRELLERLWRVLRPQGVKG